MRVRVQRQTGVQAGRVARVRAPGQRKVRLKQKGSRNWGAALDWKYIWGMDGTRCADKCITGRKGEGGIKENSQFSGALFSRLEDRGSSIITQDNLKSCGALRHSKLSNERTPSIKQVKASSTPPPHPHFSTGGLHSRVPSCPPGAIFQNTTSPG